MKLLWVTNVPSPYRVDFFNELGKSCELTVLFEKAGAQDRDDSWMGYSFTNFQGIIMKGISYAPDSAACPEVLGHLHRRPYDVVVVTNFSSPTGALAIAYLKATSRRYYLESDGGFPSHAPLKSWIKRAIIGGAHGYFSTSEVHDSYYLAYGAKPGALIRYPFTSVWDRQVLTEPPTAADKAAAKQRLGIDQENLVLSIGQFIHRKGFDVLLKSCTALPPSTAVCIVGGQPTAEYLQLIEELGLTHVRFEDFKSQEELRDYFIAADVFVLPTRNDIWGLVVNEALAHALPVVTTDRCIAGLQMVAGQDCGRIVPVDDVSALGDAMLSILTDRRTRSDMVQSALRVGRDYTVEKMAQRHVEVFEASHGDTGGGRHD